LIKKKKIKDHFAIFERVRYKNRGEKKERSKDKKKKIATPDPHSHQEAHIEMIPNTPRKGIVDY
jgi:hypothetical protein